MKSEYKIFLKKSIVFFGVFFINLIVSIILITNLGEKALGDLLIPICMIFILVPFILGEYNLCKIKSIYKLIRILLYYQMTLVIISMVGMLIYSLWTWIFSPK